MTFRVPFLRYDDVRPLAEQFLSKYHLDRNIPIPIEEIVDLVLGIDIVPMPGFSNFDVVAYISSDFTEIRVDEFVYEHRQNRYRFSLAHELGHRELHADIFKQLKFSDVTSWTQVMTDTIPREQYQYLEYHAHWFAGLILVPATELRDKLYDYIEEAQKAGVDFDKPGTGAREVVEENLAGVFKVSVDVIHIRIEHDNLWH